MDVLVLSFPVDGGHRAVIFDRKDGILAKSVGEGTHFKIPFFQVRQLSSDGGH